MMKSLQRKKTKKEYSVRALNASVADQDNQIEGKEGLEVRWLSTEEAATYLRITPTALRIRVYRGQIKSYKLGSRLRFRTTDLKDLIYSKEVF